MADIRESPSAETSKDLPAGALQFSQSTHDVTVCVCVCVCACVCVWAAASAEPVRMVRAVRSLCISWLLPLKMFLTRFKRSVVTKWTNSAVDQQLYISYRKDRRRRCLCLFQHFPCSWLICRFSSRNLNCSALFGSPLNEPLNQTFNVFFFRGLFEYKQWSAWRSLLNRFFVVN